MPRSSLAVDEKLAEELSRIAKERKVTLYNLVNEMVETSIKILKDGGNFSSLTDLWLLHKLMSEVDAILLPGDFVDDLIVSLHQVDEVVVKQKFHKLGSDLASLLKLQASDFDTLLQLAIKYLRFLPLKRIDYKYLGNSLYEVSIVGVGRKLETTDCVMEFIKGLLEQYDVRVLERELAPGLIRLKLSVGRE